MYTIQYFIDKFSAIPEDKWCSYTQQDNQGRRCAIGHCLPTKERRMLKSGDYLFPEDGSATEEGKALNILSLQCLGTYIAMINNGNDHRFQQPTEKQRVLAAFQYAKEQEAQKVIDKALCEPEEEDIEIEVEA